jgi:hypothetical protein
VTEQQGDDVKVSFATPLTSEVQRIYSEYLEMPGLRLTAQQVQRLCGLDANTCLTALQVLVDSGFLRRTPAGQYVRLSDGAAHHALGSLPIATLEGPSLPKRRAAR